MLMQSVIILKHNNYFLNISHVSNDGLDRVQCYILFYEAMVYIYLK